MAQTYSTELAGIDSVPPVKPSAISAYGARLKRFRATITMAAQPAADTIVLADLPAGYTFAYGVLTASATLGAATLAIGTATTPAKYRAAATFTTADTPTLFGTAAAGAAQAALTATERVIATIAAAALPGSGTLVIDVYASMPN